MILSGCGAGGGEVEGCLESGDCQSVVEVSRVAEELPLDPEAEFWNSGSAPKKISIELGPQMITNPKWPNPAVREVEVSAVRNGSEIAIRLEWKDSTLDNRYGHSSLYTDQAALMFPLKLKKELPPITMGDETHAVNVWQWKAIWQKGLRPQGRNRGFPDAGRNAGSPAENRASPVEDLNAQGFSTLTLQENQDVQGKGGWRDETWKVVLKRSLRSRDSHDVQFKHSVPMAIAVWNGDNRERNGQKGITGWILMKFI